MHPSKGFTLIEILIALAVIGVLSAIAFPRISGSSAKARTSELPVAASAYTTLQTLYVGEHARIGNWRSIGYSAPENGETFLYSEGDIVTDTPIENLQEGSVGWKAVNIFELNGCRKGNFWTVSLWGEPGNSVRYQNSVSASECGHLASNWKTSSP